MSTLRSKWAAGWSILGCSALLLVATALASSEAEAQPKPSGDALHYLDPDAGAVVALRISQLQDLNELVLASAPDARGSISLATLGAAAVLGWNPLQSSAWEARGFAAKERLYLQLEAIDKEEAAKADRGKASALWRTRLVLPARDPSLAKKALAQIRFREGANLDSKNAKELAALLGLSDRQARGVAKKLKRAGVFQVAKPSIVSGLLLISQHQNLFVIDLLRPYGPWNQRPKWSKNLEPLVRAVSRRPDGLRSDAEVIRSLEEAPIGLLLRPERISDLLLALELDGVAKAAPLRKNPACAPFQSLAEQGHFDALSIAAEVSAKKIHLDLRWHLRDSSALPTLLTIDEAPLIAADSQALHAVLRLDQIGRLRGPKRPALTQTWDSLWQEANNCHPAAAAFAMAVDWPHIAGLFLDEVAALHPQSNTLIGSLGPMAISSYGDGAGQELVAEAWVRHEGVAIAKSWLAALFGHEKTQGKTHRWGRGRMRPYAIAHNEGSVIGSNLISAGAGHSAPKSLQALSRGTTGDKLFVLRAQPSKLRPGLLPFPLAGQLSAWQQFAADLSLDKGQLRFTIDLQKD